MLVAADKTRDAEIADQRVVAAQQDVLRLDIAMNDAAAVRVIQRIGDLARDAQRLDERQPAAVQPLAQRLPFDERHREPEIPAGFAGIMDRQDVRMLQPSGQHDFLLKALGAKDGRKLGMQQLECHRPVVLQVMGEEHSGHTAAAELAVETITGSDGLPEIRERHRLQYEATPCIPKISAGTHF